MRSYRFFSGALAAGALVLASMLPSTTTGVLRADQSRNAAVLRSQEGRLADGLNQQRQEQGIAALVVDQSLVDIAQERAQDMVDRGYFSHITPDGTTVVDLLGAEDIPWTAVGENLAKIRGEDPVPATIRGFMASPEHRENVLDPSYARFGVGAAEASDSTVFLAVVFTN